MYSQCKCSLAILVSMLFCELMNISGMHGRICSLTKFSESWMTKSLLSLLKFSQVWKKITFYSWSYILDVSDVAEWCISRFWRSLSIFGNYVWKMYHLPGYYGIRPICILPAPRQNCLGFFWVLCQITICIRLGDLAEEETEKRRKWEWGRDKGETWERERDWVTDAGKGSPMLLHGK